MITVVAPDDVWIPALECSYSKGDHVEVPDHLGESFIAQGWKRVEPKTKKSDAKGEDSTTDDAKEV